MLQTLLLPQQRIPHGACVYAQRLPPYDASLFRRTIQPLPVIFLRENYATFGRIVEPQREPASATLDGIRELMREVAVMLLGNGFKSIHLQAYLVHISVSPS
jgi:hypothetical protein